MALVNSFMSWMIKKRFHQIELFVKYPIEVQQDCLKSLIDQAKHTEWGERYQFHSIKTYTEFIERIPLQDYESIKGDVERIMKGENNILWHSPIKWFAKSSGTTSDKSKFIPVSNESLHDCHYKGGKDMLSIYCNQVNETHIFTGKSFTTGGSHQVIHGANGGYHGDLSAILIDNLPHWVSYFRAPEKDIALMGNWEEKIEKMALSTIHENITSISGVPSWTIVLFNKILDITGAKHMKEVWPNLELYMHGAVSFKPYQQQFLQLTPNINYLETYNASEGFFGIQYELGVNDFLLMLDYGIFYEFIPLKDYYADYQGKCVPLAEVELGVNYVIVISTNAGLWRYVVGDTVVFTSLHPFRIKISGRTKHFINAFGEEVIIENTDTAIQQACIKNNVLLQDYTVAPIYFNSGTNGAHEWLIELNQAPENLAFFTDTLDNALKALNSDYEAKRFNDMVLGSPKITLLPQGTFNNWLKQQNKLGGQHKIPRLSNHRDFVEKIKVFIK